MPRRRYRDIDEDYDEYEGYEDEEAEPSQEADDVRAMPGIPTLKEIRMHVQKHAWNGGECLPRMDNEAVFKGQCEYASTAISEILTGTGLHGDPVDWRYRVRGWYSGDLSLIKTSSGCDSHAFTQGKHCHSWVEYAGKIIDPTFWQFAGGEVKVYVFELSDPRYSSGPDAED